MQRTAELKRKTSETEVSIKLSLDGGSDNNISTGIGFFDHMLNSFAVHSGFSVDILCKGDLQVDAHHSVEDCGIVLGTAFKEAVGEKTGITRFGTAAIPMDDALGWCAVDISGRPYLVFEADFSGEKTGEFETCLAEEFLRAFAFNAGITLHVKCLYGSNDHHKIEAMFKAMAHALKQAIAINNSVNVLSAKGSLA